MLKDGLGRLGKLSVTTNFGKEFDSDVKRFRFTSSVVYDASSLIEMLTPFYPSKFLLLATIANVGKSIGITTANVVRAPIQRWGLSQILTHCFISQLVTVVHTSRYT